MAETTAALPAHEPIRPRTVVVGTLFATAASLVLFLGLVVIYVLRRAETLDRGPDLVRGRQRRARAGVFIFWTLVLSAFTVQWAVTSMKNDDRHHTFWALGITALFGAAIFNQLWFILSDTGFSVDGGEAQFMFMVVNGAFIVFLIAAVVFVALTFVRALLGQFSARQSDGLEAAALFWYGVVAMWSVAWYVIYVTK